MKYLVIEMEKDKCIIDLDAFVAFETLSGGDENMPMYGVRCYFRDDITKFKDIVAPLPYSAKRKSADDILARIAETLK